MKSWATTDKNPSGLAHLWREAVNEPRICFSECGLTTDASSLQAEEEVFGRCKKCSSFAANGEGEKK